MASTTQPSLGVLNLERGLPPGSPYPECPPGCLLDPHAIGFPVIMETVEGAWAELVIRGEPKLEAACIAAARRLVERGAGAIAANCGYFIRHQAAVAASVNVPVVMSSLILVPALLRQLPRSAKLAVLCADSTKFTQDLLGVDDPPERARIVIGGIQGGKHWHDEMKRPPPTTTDIGAIETDVTALLTKLQHEHPEIAAVLLECTAFPMVASAIRRIAKGPVYDITDLCRMTLAASPKRASACRHEH